MAKARKQAVRISDFDQRNPIAAILRNDASFDFDGLLLFYAQHDTTNTFCLAQRLKILDAAIEAMRNKIRTIGRTDVARGYWQDRLAEIRRSRESLIATAKQENESYRASGVDWNQPTEIERYLAYLNA